MDLVSVIIPYYKKIKFIKKTIFSIVNQTYKNIEIIIIYDDEDISDFKFISEIQKKDKRITIIKNLRNEGAGNSRNKGIEKARGKYIAFIDSDDIWQNDKLEKQINYKFKKYSLKILHSESDLFFDWYLKEVIGKKRADYVKKILKPII